MLDKTFTLQDVESFGKDGCFTSPFRFAVRNACSDCMVVTARSYYEGPQTPYIRFYLIREGAEAPIYESHFYSIGRLGEPTRQQWRVPPAFHPALHTEIELLIPEGTKLTVSEFCSHYGNPDRWNDIGIRYNAHLGFRGVAPANTLPAVQLAAQCGFSTCIINPKEIGDGSLVCQHDARMPKYARYPDGRPADDLRSIYEMTIDEMDRWDFGLRKDEIFRGTRLLHLEEFFAVCSRTGMKPMFSAHEHAVRLTGWKKIEGLLQKYNLRRYLHVKAPTMEELELAFSVFGDSIEGYTLDHFDPAQMRNSSLYGAKCRLVIETHMDRMTEDMVKSALDSGFSVSCFPRGPSPAARNCC